MDCSFFLFCWGLEFELNVNFGWLVMVIGEIWGEGWRLFWVFIVGICLLFFLLIDFMYLKGVIFI